MHLLCRSTEQRASAGPSSTRLTKPFLPLQNKYAEGLDHALAGSQQRATLYANRAACFMEMRHWQNAARDCTEAINIDGGYLKAWHRRCKAYEALGDHERALKDAIKVREPPCWIPASGLCSSISAPLLGACKLHCSVHAGAACVPWRAHTGQHCTTQVSELGMLADCGGLC